MSFNDFVHWYDLKNKATSNIRNYQVLSSIGSDNVNLYLRHEPFSSDVGIVNIHPSKATHWDIYINENYFDSYGCASPQKLSWFNIKRNGHCLNSEYKIQSLTKEKNCSCAAYCLYIIYLPRVIGIDFNTALLSL